MRKIIIGIAVIAALVVAGTLLLASKLDSIVASAIEKYGGEVTQTNVGVSGVEISLREGRGSITDLRVANPEGYEAGDVFALGEITIQLDLGSVRQDPIVIEEVRIGAPVVRAEVTSAGNMNVEELRKRIQAYSPVEEGDAGGATKKVRIRQFVFEKGRIEVDASALGIEERTLDLPEIRLRDVGGPEGAPPDEIAKVILGEAAKRAGSEIARSEVDRLIQQHLGGDLKETAKGLLEKIGK